MNDSLVGQIRIDRFSNATYEVIEESVNSLNRLECTIFIRPPHNYAFDTLTILKIEVLRDRKLTPLEAKLRGIQW